MIKFRTKFAYMAVGFQMCGVFIFILCSKPSAVIIAFVFGFLSWLVAEYHGRTDESQFKGE